MSTLLGVVVGFVFGVLAAMIFIVCVKKGSEQ